MALLSKPIPTDPKLLELIERSRDAVAKMTPKERAEMHRLQAESNARSCIQDKRYTFRDNKLYRKTETGEEEVFK